MSVNDGSMGRDDGDQAREVARLIQRNDQATAAYVQTAIAGYAAMLRGLRAEGLTDAESMDIVKTIVHARETAAIVVSFGRPGEGPKT